MSNTIYDLDYQRKLLKLCSINRKFFVEYGIELIKEEFFETPTLRHLFNIISNYLNKYEKELDFADSLVLIDDFVNAKGYSSETFRLIKEECRSIFNATILSEELIAEVLKKFAQRQSLKIFLKSAITTLEQDGPIESIVNDFNKALSIGQGSNQGLEFSDLINFPRRYKSKYSPDKLLRTGFPQYDHALSGGMAAGELHVVMAPPKCYLAGTLIKLLNGTSVPIESLLNRDEFWVYSCKPDGTIVPGRGHSACITKYATEIYEIKYDNGKITRSSDDHEFMMRDGSYRAANKLKIGDSVMPLYLKRAAKGEFLEGRLLVKNNMSNEYEFVHHMVARNYHEDYLKDGKTIAHHIIRDIDNNDPSNLQPVTRKQHDEIHHEERSQLMTNLFADKNSLLSVNHKRELTFRNKHRWANDKQYRVDMTKILNDNLAKLTESGQQRENCSRGGLSVMANPVYRNKLCDRPRSESDREVSRKNGRKVMLKLHADLEFQKRNSIRSSKTMTETNNRLKDDPAHKAKMRESVYDNPEFKATVSKSQKENFKNPEYVRNLKYKNCIRVISALLDKKLEINKENYESERKLGGRTKYNGCGSWDTYTGSRPDHNHKIAAIRVIKYDEPQQLYCFKVDGYNNFAVDLGDDSGVFSHNCGKSTFASNVGAYALMQGKNVFHASLEIKEDDVMFKYAARLSGMTYKEILEVENEGRYNDKIEKFNKYKPNLFVNYWTQGTASTLNLRAWISKINSKQDVKPDLIIVDYDDLLVATTGASDDMYQNAGQIYGDLIRLGDQWQCPVLTFAQPVRSSWNKAESDDLIYSYELAHSAKKAHACYSVSSLNFPKDSDRGILYVDLVRRGISSVKIPIERDLSRGLIKECSEDS